MAKKKRRHGGGRPAWYSQYQFQGEKLTKAQKAYNEEIRKAASRIKAWEKKLSKKEGREVKLDLLPSVPARATKQRIAEIRDISWQNLGKRLVRTTEGETYLKLLIDGISDIDSHFKFNKEFGKKHGITAADWKEKKGEYRDLMLKEVFDYRDRIGPDKFYARLARGESVRELQRLSWDLYEIASDTPDDYQHGIAFTKFKNLLTGNVASDQELRRDRDNASVSDLFQNNSGWWNDYG